MPPSGSNRARQFREAVERGDLQSFEELWLQTMDTAPEDVDSFLAGIDALHVQGNVDKAGLFLSMLSPVLLERGLHAQALRVLTRMAKIAPRERGLRHGLLTAYKALLAEDPRLPILLEKSGIETSNDLASSVEKMEQFLGFQPGRYLFHPAGWGAGRVVSVEPAEMMVVIDFESRRGHRMSMEMASKVTEFMDSADLRAMKLDRKEQLQSLAEDDPVEIIRMTLRSRRGKASLRDLRDRITAGVVDPKAWSRWWQKARTRIKTAPDITMTPGTNPTLELGAAGRGYPQACLRDLAMLDGDAAGIRYFRDLMSEAANHEDGTEAIAAVAKVLVGPRGDGGALALGPRISLAFLLGDAKSRFPAADLPGSLAPADILDDPAHVVEALPEVPISGHRLAALAEVKQSFPKEWPALCQQIIIRGEPDSAEHCVFDLVRSGQGTLANAAVRTVADRYREHFTGFLWYVKAALGEKLPKSVPRDRTPVLLEKALLLHDHLQILALKEKDNDEIKRVSKALVTLFQAREYAIVKDAFAAATAAEGVNIATILRNNRSIHRETWHQMQAAMFRTRPELARMEKEESREVSNPLFDPGVLYCTEAALLRKRIEFEDLVNRQIPENAAEIGRAASYGDLSENSEWSAAIEKQSRLTRQSEEMAAELAKARIIDTGNQDGETVSLGSRVRVRDPDGQTAHYTILGPWEVDSEKGIISYLSPLGQSLVGRRVGAKVTVEARSGPIVYAIEDISDGVTSAGA